MWGKGLFGLGTRREVVGIPEGRGFNRQLLPDTEDSQITKRFAVSGSLVVCGTFVAMQYKENFVTFNILVYSQA